MRKLIFALLIIMPVIAFGQNINGRISSALYTFERFDSQNSSDKYIRTFENIGLNFNYGQFSLITRTNLEANIGNSLDNDPRLRFYNLYIEARKLFDFATIKVGRQSNFNNVAGGLFDGIDVKLEKYDFTLSGFFGGNVPAYQKLQFTDDLKNDYILGGKIETGILPNTRFAISYIDKNFKAVDYTSLRINNNLDPIQILIQQKSNQYKFLSGEVSYTLDSLFNVYAQYDYDLNFNATSKFEITGRYEQIKNLGIEIYYNYREPLIRYNSIFSVFDYGNTYEIEGSLDYKIFDGLTVLGKFANVEYKDASSERYTLGLSSDYGSISYRKNLGYAGEMDAVSIFTGYSFFNGLLTPSAGISFTTYKLSEDDAKNNLTTILAGFNFRPWKSFSVDIQGQYMDNKIYKDDFRLLAKINYWFNTNL
jgi:hypothetical protein